MIIDVQDSALNWFLNLGFFAILLLTLLSLFPWQMNKRNRWVLLIPVLSLLIYLLYEYVMPSRWDIRLDLIIIWPALLLTASCSVFRLIKWLRQKTAAKR